MALFTSEGKFLPRENTMRVKYLLAALIGASFIALPALAQSPNTKTMSSQQSSNSEQNASAAGLWQGSKLVGINVYDEQNEKIGDIKELMVDKPLISLMLDR